MKLVLPLLLTALGGFALGWFVSSATEHSSRTNRHEDRQAITAQPSTESKLAAVAQSTTESATVPTPPSPETRASEGLISATLRKYALEELDAGWHETRKDPLPEPLLARGFGEFEETVRRLPREIGRRLAEEQSQIESLASDDPFTVLEAIEKGSLGPQVDLVQDKKRFGAFFACAGGPSVDGPALVQEPETNAIPPGAVVVFPAGVHDIENLTRRLQQKSPSCLAICGAGMDRTLIEMRSILTVGRLDRFELRDCTVLSNCDAIDLRAAGVWRAERVRFIGFDCGAGGCGVFDVGGGAVLEMKSCRIEGGFGRNPGDGCLFDSRSSVMLVHIEDCTLDSLHLSAVQWGRGMTVVFDRCRLVNMLDDSLPVDRAHDGLVLNATTMELRPADAGRLQKRELAELFPAWFQPTKR
jgi:hypothetical protein